MASLLPALLPPLSPCSKTELLPLLPRTNLLPFFVPTRSHSQPALRRLLAFATTSLSAPPGPNPHTINTPTVRIVYVVLEAQYQSSLSAAAQSLNSSRFPASIQISGYLVEDLRKEISFRRFCDDLSTANIFIGSLIFVEDIAEKVRSAVEQERPRLDAVLIFPSMPDLMRLNKLGSFSLPQLRRSQNPLVQLLGWKKSSGFADAMLKLLRSLPKVLKYLPSDKARDARHYILGLQFWLCASPENLQNFLKMLCGHYSPALKPQNLDFGEPVLLPESGIWHPSAPRMFEDLGEYLNWYKSRGRRDPEESPVIGLMLQRSHIVSGDEAHYAAVIEELEGRGASAVAIFCAGFDFSGPVQKYFVDEAKGGAVVHAAVSLTGFALVGGPARQDLGRAVEVLRKLDVPYLVGLPLVLQTTEEWESSDLGLHPVQVALQVALPELEGGIEPIVFSGRHAKTGKSHALPKRVEKLCERAIKWADLKRKPKKEKKVAITAFCFPPDKGNVGTAAYLNVFSSIFSVVGELKKDGYHVSDFPSSSDSLLREIIGEDHPAGSSPSLRVAYRMPVREYKYLTPFASALEPSWGKPPGTLNSDGESLLIHGKQYGNIFIGVQPSFGYEGDPMRLLFSRSASPHHGFAAYYSFIRAVFAADAVIHFGTHGALEFMPGKQVGMSDDCFPDLLIGSIPNIYFYAVNNPSEATIAKRRSYASTISYATPPAEYAGLYKGLKQISDLISSYGSLKHAGRRGQQIVGSIISTAIQCNLDKDVSLPPSATELSTEEMDLVVGKVYSKIMEIESRLIPCGLHVIGEPPSALETATMLAGIAGIDRPEDGISSLTGILADSVGRKADDLHRGSAAGILDDVEILGEIRDASQGAIGAFLESVAKKTGRPAMLGFSAEPWIEYLSRTKFKKADRGKLRDVFRFLGECLGLLMANNELGNLKRALEGGYVEPGPGGDPIRNPKVLPTGRNMHALDPQAIPTEAAMESAKVVVDGLLERQKVDNGGRYPETVAVVLWGTDNIKTYGESLAQVMWMIGVRPIPDAFGRVNRVEPVCLDELRRPRIDVVVNCSGVFRDLFINQMNLLDRAVKTVAELAEPTEQNYVRKHALEQAAELGVPVQEAATRVFSNAAGSYSSNVGLAVENSSWNDERQLQEMYLSRKSFAFDSDAPSGGGAGMTAKRRLFETALRTAEATFQNLDSSEISVTDVSHYFDLDPTNVVRSLRRDGKKPGAYVADGGKVRTVAEAVRLDVRTKLLNPRWQEGVLRMGYEGVREIERRLTCTVGWSATSGEVDNWVYEEANQSFIGDEGMLRRLMEANPRSFQRMVQTFLEASGRGYWDTSFDNLHRLRSLYSRLEDTIEGVLSPLPPPPSSSSSSCLK